MPDKKLPISEFAAKLKVKYPEYKDFNDTDLVIRVTTKYPQYKDVVDLSGLSKKKEVSEPALPTGGKVGISEVPSEEGGAISKAISKGIETALQQPIATALQQPKVKQAIEGKQREDVLSFLQQEKAKAPTKITGPTPTMPTKGVILPAKSLKKVETSFALPKEKIDNIVVPTFKEVASSADPLGAIEQKESGEKDLQRKADLMAVSTLVKEQIPNFYQAFKAAQSPLPDTRTNQLTKERAANYESATRGLREIKAPDLMTANNLFIESNIIPQIERAAVMYHINKYPSFQEELDAVNTSVDNPNLPNALGSAKMGQIMQEFLYSPEVIAFENQEDSNIGAAIQRAREVNLSRNTMWGVSVVGNKVSQAFERSPYRRNAIAGFDTPALRSDLNTVATQVLTPEEYKIYDLYVKGNEDKYLDVPSFFERFARGGEGVFNGVYNTLSKITGYGKSTEEIVRENWEKEALNVTADPEGLRNFLAESGNVVGLVAALGATGRVATPIIGAAAAGTGLPAATTTSIADAVNVSTAFLGDMLDQGTIKYPNDPVKAYTSGIFNTAAFVAMGRSIFPLKNVQSVFNKAKPEIDQVVANLTNGSITREAAKKELNTIVKKGVDVLGAGLAQNVKVSAELTALQGANEILDIALGMDPEKLKKLYPENTYGESFKHLFLSNALVSAAAGYGKVKQKNTIARESIYEAASNPKRYSNIIEQSAVKDPTLNKQELLDNLAFSVEVKRLLDQRGVPVEKQKDYLILALGERVALAEKAKIQDSTLRKEVENKISEAQKEKEAILTAPEEVAAEEPVAPELPAAEELTYRVDYFDPETNKMASKMFATEKEGSAFQRGLTSEQNKYGSKGYYTSAKGVGEVTPKAAPEVPAAPETPFFGEIISDTVNGITYDGRELNVNPETGDLLPFGKGFAFGDVSKKSFRNTGFRNVLKDVLNKYKVVYTLTGASEDVIKVAKKLIGDDVKVKEFEQNGKKYYALIDAKYDAELAALGVREVKSEAAPEVPKAQIAENFKKDFNEGKLERGKEYGGGRNLGVYDYEGGIVKVVKEKRKLGADQLTLMKERLGDMDNVYIPKAEVDLGEGKSAVVMDKATGIDASKLTKEDIDAIPQEHWDKFEADIRELSKRGVAVDLTKRDNFFYDKDKGFSFIDISGISIEGEPTTKFFVKDGVEMYYPLEQYPFSKKFEGGKKMFQNIAEIKKEEAAPEVPKAPETQKKSIENIIKQEELDISPDQLDRLYDEAVKGGGKIEESQIRKILNVGYLRASRIAEEINDLGVREVKPEVPKAPEKTQDEVAKEQTKETDLLLGGQAEQRRKDGKYTKDGVEYVRNPKGQGAASEVTGEVRFTNEVSLPFKYKLVEAETLQPSHQDGIRNPLHFIPEAQPKNRNDIGSLQAEESFANNPRFSELGENTNAYSGAPVVNERGEVVQGNNRSAGLRKGYQRNNPQYKNDLAANAEQFGFTREQVEGMKNPVLVREVAVSDQGAIELGNYDAKDLETGGKRRIDPVAVTRRMPFDVKGRIADLFTGEETLNQAIRSNQKRLLELLNPYLNQAQRNTITREGVLTDAGIKDLEAVVQQFLFDNGDTALPDLFENLSATQKEGLRKSLPYIYSAGIEKSIIPEIQEAILAANEYKESGAGDFNAWLAQGDIFNEGKTPRDKYTELELAIARTLVESKTQKEISKKFIEYADKVKDKEADMFEPAKPGQSKEQGVQETFNVKYNAKPISERGGKEVAPKEKPAAEPSAEKRPKEAKREPELPETDKRAEARKKLKDALDDFLNAGIVYDPRSQAEKQVRLTKAIINAIREEAIGAIKDLKKYLKENIGIDISDNDAKYLLIESKKPEYAIQEPAAGEVPVQPEAGVSGKVEAGVPPTEPPKVTPEGESPRKERQKALLNRIVDSSKTPEDLKLKIKEKGLSYLPATQAEATRLANSVIDSVGIDQAVEMASKSEFSDVFGGLNTAVLSEAASRLVNDPVKQAQIFDALDTTLRSKGQDISYMNEFYAKNPLGVVIYENTRRKNDFDQWSTKKEKQWQDAYDVLKAEKEALKKELEELRIEKPTTEGVQRAKVKAEKARQKRADIIEKYKNKGGGLTLTTGGLTKEGIEFVGEVSLTYIQEGVANAEVVIRKVLADLKTVIGKDITPEVRNEVEQIVRRVVNDKKGAPVIDRIRKKLEGLTNKEKEEVIRQSYKKIIESGALEFEDFKNIIADVLGRGPLSEADAQKLKDLTVTINELEAKALDAQELRTPEALKAYKIAQKEAAEASKELSNLFNNKPNILKRISQLIQLRTLGIVALTNNPFYNVVNQAFLRFPIGLTNTLIDRAVSAGAKVANVQINPSTNVLSRRVQAEYFKKLKLGFKESGEQLFTGLNRQDYIQKETYAQSIQPIESMKALYRYAKGKQKMSLAEVVDRSLQATGADAEAVARTLNLGDKPFRFGSEGATAADFSEALGLSKGIDYELFIEFPKAEAYRIYKKQGLSDAEATQKAEYIEKSIIQEGKRAAFQQDNFLSDLLKMISGEVSKKTGAGVGELTSTLVVSPYIKTPTNVFWSYYNLLHPEVALLQAFAYGGKAYKLREKDPTASKLALREARFWFGHAVTGIAYVSVISSMVGAGIFTAGSTAEDTKKEREGRSYYGKPGTTNVTKLMAWLRGEDPTQIKGGYTIKNSWFGHIGTLGNAIARREQEMTPEQLKNRGDLMDRLISNLDRDNLFPEALEGLQSGIFANTSSLLNAAQSDFFFKRWGLNTINLLTNVVQPATLAQISRAELPYYSSTKADSFMGELRNSMLQRSSMFRALTGEEPPAKVGIWGDRLERKDNFMMRWFGISKENPDNFAQPLYDIVKRTNNIGYFPSSIKPEIEDQGKTSKLNAKQTIELEMMVGQYRKNLVAPLLNDFVDIGKYGVWSELEDYFKGEGLSNEEARKKADELKLDALRNAYDYGFELGKEAFLDAHPEFRNLDYDNSEMKDKKNAMEKVRKQLKQF